MARARHIYAVTTDGHSVIFDVSQEDGLTLEVVFPDRTTWGFDSLGGSYNDLADLAGYLIQQASTHTLEQVKAMTYRSIVAAVGNANRLAKCPQWGKKFNPTHDSSLFNIFTPMPDDEEFTIRTFTTGGNRLGIQVDGERSGCCMIRVEGLSPLENKWAIGRLCGWLLCFIIHHNGADVAALTEEMCEEAVGIAGVTHGRRHVLRHSFPAKRHPGAVV